MEGWGVRTGGIASAIGYAMAGAVRRVAESVDVVVTSDDPAGPSSCSDFADQLLREAASKHVIVPFWSAHQLTLGVLTTNRCGFRPAFDRFEIVADDSLGGQIVRDIGRRLAVPMRPLHVGKPERLADLAAWMRSPAPFFIAVDGGGPYGTVQTGIVRLAARLASTVWPIALSARRSIRVPRIIAEMPLPRTTVAVALAKPFVITRDLPADAAANLVKASLDGATSRAIAVANDPAAHRSVARR